MSEQATQDAAPTEAKKSWLLYILECGDGSFYTGITNELERRVRQHNDGLASRCTRSRRPVKVVYLEDCANRSDALSRERAIKSLSRADKQRLIENAGRAHD
ncbi:MAG: GIY-YIG nuclease family protein [Pseudomonadota bacterium]